MASHRPSYTIPKLKERETYRRWLDSVYTAAEILKLTEFMEDPYADITKMKDTEASAYSQLKLHIMETLSDRLYEIVKGELLIKTLTIASIIGRLTAHFKPKYIFGDLRLRQQLFSLKLDNYNSLTDYVLAIRHMC